MKKSEGYTPKATTNKPPKVWDLKEKEAKVWQDQGSRQIGGKALKRCEDQSRVTERRGRHWPKLKKKSGAF